MKKGEKPEYAKFANTGLERGTALTRDLAWFAAEHGISPTVSQDGPGHVYARFLEDLAAKDAPAFLCHWYNQYFAHTAGGLMIGKKVRRNRILLFSDVF